SIRTVSAITPVAQSQPITESEMPCPGRRWVTRLGAPHALALGGLAALVRWVALSAEPDLWLLWPLQVLHALSFGLAHLAAMAFLASALPGRMIASVQGVMTGVLGGGLSALVVVLAGDVVDGPSIAPAYWIAAVAALVSMVAGLALKRIWGGGVLVVDPPVAKSS
ncbi:MAG: MFS transporter, partial [Pseudomonadota bacterium]